MADIKNILKEIKSLNDDVDVFIPSMNQAVKIKQLSVKQCKELINMPQNILHAQYAFFRKLYNILKENAPEYADQFNIIDRVCIILSLRAKALDTYQELSLSKDVIPNLPNITYNLLAPVITTKNYTFTLEIPTLKSEDVFNKFIMNTYKLDKDFKLENVETLTQEIFGELAVIELCKYVTHISIPSQDMEIDMQTLSPTQRKEIIESIQLEELQEVVDFNNKTHVVEASYANVKDKNIQIDIGPDFFVFI